MSVGRFRASGLSLFRVQFALALSIVSLCSSWPSGAQTAWEKMKLQFLDKA